MKQIPEIGKTYNCFDDGKINFNRLYRVTVIDVIPFDKIDKKILKQWQDDISHYNWLYSEKTDYFIITDNGYIIPKENEEKEVFVRTIYGEWFSIGPYMSGGILDIDGSLTKKLKDYKQIEIANITYLNQDNKVLKPDIIHSLLKTLFDLKEWEGRDKADTLLGIITDYLSIEERREFLEKIVNSIHGGDLYNILKKRLNNKGLWTH